ncbi:L-isoaspartate O-methyltransferase (macronuclear) [Tetrahymena thermophila SB210]|uniref:Protein-L-isoaspartate O-methyltransferase n=1 Tax=Tetrahymena thermophila (strain SB210) TaxID=312017 RepID=I7M1Y0_TETTS|nr:L-isoaspartate O-methyltransferase [Tetrahymena thermophila SB210]EAR98000.2 L-isoaspartate O-methyltransferase [Tetrahymena thermophila SB210]|eukprot:XP_001018245.2 L-isoaspartate O-methyltransferase [Tetrahymena thermophila SB210]
MKLITLSQKIKRSNTLQNQLVFLLQKNFIMSNKRHNKSQKELVEELIQRGTIKTQEVELAMLSVDRSDFINKDPYLDIPQQIGYNVTISAPHMHAFSLSYLQRHLISGKPVRVLDIGCGTGYLCPAFLKMIPVQFQQQSTIVGIDHVKDLVQLSDRNIRKSFSQELDKKQIILVTGDGREGYQQLAPYDAIHVGAAAEKIPEALLQQLNFGGRMLIPVGKHGGEQEFLAIDKDLQGKITQTRLFGVSYVPLTSIQKQLGTQK